MPGDETKVKAVLRIRIRMDPFHLVGSGSVSETVDLDPIWIRVAPQTNQNHSIKKSKLSVNILFTQG